jgi:hypothetical protein
MPRGQLDGSLRPYSRFSRQEPLLFSENLVEPEIKPVPLDPYPGTLTTRPQRRSIFFYITYINSVRTSQETQYISIL